MTYHHEQNFVLRPEGGSGAPVEISIGPDGTMHLKGCPSAQIRVLRHETGGLLTVLWGHRVVSGVLTRENGQLQLLRVNLSGKMYSLRLRDAALDAMEQGLRASQTAAGTISVTSPIPGLVKAIAVKAGDNVKASQMIIVLEAMKMENEIAAPHDGVVDSIDVQPGYVVGAGALLAKIKLNG